MWGYCATRGKIATAFLLGGTLKSRWGDAESGLLLGSNSGRIMCLLEYDLLSINVDRGTLTFYGGSIPQRIPYNLSTGCTVS